MKPLKLVISLQAVEDMIDLWAYVAEDSPVRADRFIDRIHEKCKLIAGTPRIGRERLELAPGLRSFPVGRYLTYYRVREDALEIIRILSGFRDLDILF